MLPKSLLVVLMSFYVGASAASAQLLFTNFGADVAVYGDEVLVSEPNSRYRAGIVYVFRRDVEMEWTEHMQITASDAIDYDGFGHAISISGDDLLVGAARRHDGRGGAYVFKHRAGEGWVETAILTVDDVEQDDGFGLSVAMEGAIAAVGAPGSVAYGPPGHPDRAGSVYVFRKDGATWRQEAELTASAPTMAAAFGHDVVIVDGRIIVGAPGQNRYAGAAYVFTEVDGEWIETAALTASETEDGAEFGAALDATSEKIFVGAPGQGTAGEVFVFERAGSDERWSLEHQLYPFDTPDAAGFGTSIDIGSSGAIWIGAPLVDGARGTVYVSELDGQTGSYTSTSRLEIEQSEAMDYAGSSVAVGADLGTVALQGADGMTGAVAIFQRNESRDWLASGLVRSDPANLPAIVGTPRDCVEGAAEVFGCSKVDLLAFLPVESIGGDRGIWVNDLWGWTDPETGKEYVLIGRTDGTSFVDISDPSNPIFVGELPKTEGSQTAIWRDVKVYKDHAFIVADNAGRHGVQIFDLRRLRDVPEMPFEFDETARYDGIHSAHNIVINEDSGFAFSVGNSGGGETCGGGLHMINIGDPTNPVFAGCFAHQGTGFQSTGYTHDAQCVTYNGPDEVYRGREICLSANETALSIGDVTDKENVKFISTGTYPNSAYVHQGWLTEDHRYFYINDEGDEVSGIVDQTRTLIWDVTDLDDPQLAKEYTWGERSSDHNLYIRGNLMYQSNYLGGLRIHDISDPVNPTEVAHFDTVPTGDNGPGFAGSWSNYPFFESEIIAVSSMGEGLFLLKKQSEVGL